LTVAYFKASTFLYLKVPNNKPATPITEEQRAKEKESRKAEKRKLEIQKQQQAQAKAAKQNDKGKDDKTQNV